MVEEQTEDQRDQLGSFCSNPGELRSGSGGDIGDGEK